jgi:hypothetical protein
MPEGLIDGGPLRPFSPCDLGVRRNPRKSRHQQSLDALKGLAVNIVGQTGHAARGSSFVPARNPSQLAAPKLLPLLPVGHVIA